MQLLLETSEYRVRGVSSDPTSDKAKALLERYSKYVTEGRFELVEGNLNDRKSLETAIEGSYGLYAAFAPSFDEVPIEQNPEVLQGKNLVDAAKAVGVKHFVYSSLPSIAKLTGGEITTVYPFEAKSVVEEYARSELENSTFVIPGSFYANLVMPVWVQRRENGVFTFVAPTTPGAKVGWVDEQFDMGTFVTAIFKKGPAVTANKTYPINSTPVTYEEFADTYTSVTGEPAQVDPMTMETFTGMLASFAGPGLSNGLTNMMKFLTSRPPSQFTYGPGYIENERDLSFEDLGVKASSPREFLERTGFRASSAPPASH